jgi:hypothetical protein
MFFAQLNAAIHESLTGIFDRPEKVRGVGDEEETEKSEKRIRI